jgi:SAM-dependent methyltransferase
MRPPLLSPLLTRMRVRRVLPAIRRHPDCRLLDIGCGYNAPLLRAAEPYVREAIGIDPRAPAIDGPRLRTVRTEIEGQLPFEPDSFDVVTMLAVLEHLSHPERMIAEIARVLRPGGQLVMTVPSHASKPVLEFLAYRLHVVSEFGVRDHKRYYGRKSLHKLLEGTGLRIEGHAYFQLGMNNYVCATRA